MKRKFLLILFLLLGIAMQAVDVPDKVQASFKAKFKKAKSIDWMEWDDRFVASFWQDKNYKEAHFSKEGKWLLTNILLEEANLPLSIRASLEKVYMGASILFVTRQEIEIDQQVQQRYLIDIVTKNGYFKITCSLQGKIVAEEELDEEEVSNDGSKR